MLEAKREYVTRLSDDLAPFVLGEIKDAYDAARKANSNKALLGFQLTLKGIRQWNSVIVREKTAAVESKCPWLASLIAACFVSYIKVMSSVRVTQDHRPNIKLKLPTNDVFVHRVYTEAARMFYENPQLIRDKSSVQFAVVRQAIEVAVRDQLPLQDILEVYLGTSVDTADGTMAPILSPVHSDDDEPTQPADDSLFARTGHLDDADDADDQQAPPSSSSSDADEEQEKYINVDEHSHHQHQGVPQPPPAPQLHVPPPPQHPSAYLVQPHHQPPPPVPQPQQYPPPSSIIPQAPKSLFADAEDGHFG